MDQIVIDRLQQLEDQMRFFNTSLASIQNGASGEVSPIIPSSPLALLQKNFIDFTLTVSSFASEVRRMMAEQSYRQDEAEQYSRRNCLVIHHVPETRNEDVYEVVQSLFSQKLNLQVGKEYIDRAHRLNRRKATDGSDESSRPIIVKFSHYHKREDVFRNKKMLKGSKISITESLTQDRLALLKKCKDIYGFRACWTVDGRVAVLVNDKKHYITRTSQIQNLPSPPPAEVTQEEKNKPPRRKQNKINYKE